MKHGINLTKLLAGLFIIVAAGMIQELKAQKGPVIYRQEKPSKRKALKLDRYYTFKTTKGKYLSHIVDFTDSSLKIINYVEVTRQKGREEVQTLRRDTISIPFKEILCVESPWFRNAEWLTPFAYFALAGAGSFALAGIVAVAEGPEAGLECVKAGSVILGVTLPVIFIGTRSTKYEMQNKWAFRGH